MQILCRSFNNEREQHTAIGFRLQCISSVRSGALRHGAKGAHLLLTHPPSVVSVRTKVLMARAGGVRSGALRHGAKGAHFLLTLLTSLP
jgi:hypothetical protein